MKIPPITKEHLYFNDDNEPNYEKNRAYYAKPFDSDENYLRTLDERWHDSDLQNRMNLFLRPRIRKLCRGKVRFIKHQLVLDFKGTYKTFVVFKSVTFEYFFLIMESFGDDAN